MVNLLIIASLLTDTRKRTQTLRSRRDYKIITLENYSSSCLLWTRCVWRQTLAKGIKLQLVIFKRCLRLFYTLRTASYIVFVGSLMKHCINVYITSTLFLLLPRLINIPDSLNRSDRNKNRTLYGLFDISVDCRPMFIEVLLLFQNVFTSHVIHFNKQLRIISFLHGNRFAYCLFTVIVYTPSM